MKLVRFLLLVWALLLVESVLVRVFGWSVTRVDVTVTAVVFLALRAATFEGALASFACGYLLDVMGGQPTGLYLFLAMLTFLVARVFGSLVDVRSPLSFALFSAAADFGHGLTAAFLTWLTAREGRSSSAMVAALPMQALVTGAAAWVLYPLFRKLDIGSDRPSFGELGSRR